MKWVSINNALQDTAKPALGRPVSSALTAALAFLRCRWRFLASAEDHHGFSTCVDHALLFEIFEYSTHHFS